MITQRKISVKTFGSFVVLIWAIVFLTNCSSKSKSADANANANSNTSKNGPVRVQTAPAVMQQVPTFVQGTGTFVADEETDVAPKVSGQVISTAVDVGDFVKQGQTIAKLDDKDAQLRLQQAQAAQQQAQVAVQQAAARLGIGPDGKFDVTTAPEVQSAYQNYLALVQDAKLAAVNEQRYANLLKTGDTSRLTYDQQRTTAETSNAKAKAALRQFENAKNVAAQNYQGIASAQAALTGARTQVNIAQKAIADSVIYAPFAGSVNARPVSVGEYVTPSSKIATIVRTSPIKLSLPLPESDAGKIKVGMSVTASVSSYPERNFSGQISAITPSLDVSSRSVIIEAQFDNSDGLLRPGMFASARVLMPGGEPGIFVPASAIITDPTTKATSLYVVDNGTARLKVVQTGESEGDLVRIISGVDENETVVTDNIQELFDGATVVQ